MTLTCIHPFGNFAPGDQIEVPEGAAFDTAYFAAKSKSSTTSANSDASPEENKE